MDGELIRTGGRWTLRFERNRRWKGFTNPRGQMTLDGERRPLSSSFVLQQPPQGQRATKHPVACLFVWPPQTSNSRPLST